METDLTLAIAWRMATALAIGALVGIEREKRKTAEGPSGVGGLRTFVLVALAGALAGWLTEQLGTAWPAGVVLVSVALLLAIGYALVLRAKLDEHLGLTTEVAALVVLLLGVLAGLGQQALAGALGVVTAATLAYKQPLHGLVAKLGWDDVYAVVRLGVATFVVLPLLPDRPLDPWVALNPYKLWLLVILISGLSLVGYVATRMLGQDRAAAITGITGGLVSSTATTLSFARESRSETATPGPLAAGILLAWAVMFARVLVIVAAVNAGLLATLAMPIAAMGVACGAVAGLFLLRAARRTPGAAGEEVPLENPFSLLSAAKFAGFLAIVLLAVAIVRAKLPGQGVYVVAALAGLTDVDAITLSMAGETDPQSAATAVTAIVIACLSNTAVKAGMVAALGSAGLRWRVLLGTAAVVAAAAGAWMVMQG